MLKLKLRYFGHLMLRADWHWKGPWCWVKIEGRRRRGWQRMKWLDGITDSMAWVWANSGRWWRTGRPVVVQSVGSQKTEWLNKNSRLPCPSLSPWVCSNQCPLSRWCYLIISFSAAPFSCCLQSFLASGSFPMSQLFNMPWYKAMVLVVLKCCMSQQ